MPGSQPACVICSHRIVSRAQGRTITSQHHERLQTFATREIDVDADRAHHKCWEKPHLHAYLKPPSTSVIERSNSNMESKYDIDIKNLPTNQLDTLADVAATEASSAQGNKMQQRAQQEQLQLLQKHQQHLTSLEQQWQQQKGPFTAALDDTINAIGVHRQAYHGGSLVGNDCLKLLNNAKKISAVFRPRTLTIKPTSTQRPRRRTTSRLTSQAQEVTQVFSSHQSSQRAYTLLHKTKQIFDLAYAARPLCKHEQVIFIMRACSFGCWFPRAYPDETITPKMHITIFEMTKLLQRYGTIGMFSEQAIESLHAVFNKLNRQHVSMKCDEKRVEAVMKKAWVFHHPVIQSD